jgi:hypothetical protein
VIKISFDWYTDSWNGVPWHGVELRFSSFIVYFHLDPRRWGFGFTRCWYDGWNSSLRLGVIDVDWW